MREVGNTGKVWHLVEDDLPYGVPQAEEKCESEERSTIMANSMQSPPQEYSPPPIPGSALPPIDRQQRKSSSRGWSALAVFLAVSVVATVLLVLGVGFAVNTYGGPTIASDQYYTAIRNQDYPRAYSFLGSELKTVYTQEAFTHMAQQRDTTSGKVSHFAYNNAPLGGPATANLTITRTNGTTYTVELQIRQEAGAWKITSFDRI